MVGPAPSLPERRREAADVAYHAGVVGFPLLSVEGRVGNVARGRVMLVEIASGRESERRE